MNCTDSTWDPTTGILRTELKGSITTDDVRIWRQGLYQELARIPDGGRFRLLLDLYGFEPASLDAHEAMRTVVPELLASHGLRPAFIDLFGESAEMEISTSRGVRCVAFANVHHDPAKMAGYQERIARTNQMFFTDSHAAEEWLLGYRAPAWHSRGKTIAELVRELQSFEDQNLEVRLSVDDGRTSVPISLVAKSRGVALLMSCETDPSIKQHECS